MIRKTLYFMVLSLFVATSVMATEEGMKESQPAPAAASNLTAELKIGTGIENRDIVGEAESFPAGTEQLSAWSKISGATTPTKIQHVWMVDGQEVDAVSLNVSSSPFRTYSRKTIAGRMGKWTVQVKDESGNILATKDVMIENTKQDTTKDVTAK